MKTSIGIRGELLDGRIVSQHTVEDHAWFPSVIDYAIEIFCGSLYEDHDSEPGELKRLTIECALVDDETS